VVAFEPQPELARDLMNICRVIGLGNVTVAELGLLRGAEGILRRHAPLLVFECENRHLAPGNVWDVFSYLAGLGYEGSFVCGNRLLPLSQFDAAVHQRQDGEWSWKTKDYCNNFVFRKPLGTSPECTPKRL
jgi:hypothetical protein